MVYHKTIWGLFDRTRKETLPNVGWATLDWIWMGQSLEWRPPGKLSITLGDLGHDKICHPFAQKDDYANPTERLSWHPIEAWQIQTWFYFRCLSIGIEAGFGELVSDEGGRDNGRFCTLGISKLLKTRRVENKETLRMSVKGFGLIILYLKYKNQSIWTWMFGEWFSKYLCFVCTFSNVRAW